MTQKVTNAIDKLNLGLKKHLEKLDKISKDIKDLESILKKLSFPSFKFTCVTNKDLYWDKNDRRLKVKMTIDSYRPLIETNISLREMYHPFLDTFITAFMEKNNLTEI